MSKKKLFQWQQVYAINLDIKDAVRVTVILILMIMLARVVLQDSGQNHAVKDFGNNNDVLWVVFLEGTVFGT